MLLEKQIPASYRYHLSRSHDSSGGSNGKCNPNVL